MWDDENKTGQIRHVYVVVRDDLESRHKAVQATHAGIVGSARLFPNEVVHPSLVLCTVPDEQTLIDLSNKLILDGIIEHEIFQEADMNNEMTAICTEPITGDLRKIFQDLPLLK